MVSGKAFDPALVVASPLHQNLFGNQRDAHDFVKEVNHVLRTRQHRQITVNHDTVETVIHKHDQAAVQAHKRFPWAILSRVRVWPSTSSDRSTMINLRKNFKYLWLDFRLRSPKRKTFWVATKTPDLRFSILECRP